MHNTIPHTDPDSPGSTRDATDTGVPMAAATAPRPTGPEDAYDQNARGDYSNRVAVVDTSVHYTSELIPESERVPGGPMSRLVAQSPNAAEIGDVPGKGGVSQ
jgi:hypothetical protein